MWKVQKMKKGKSKIRKEGKKGIMRMIKRGIGDQKLEGVGNMTKKNRKGMKIEEQMVRRE